MQRAGALRPQRPLIHPSARVNGKLAPTRISYLSGHHAARFGSLLSSTNRRALSSSAEDASVASPNHVGDKIASDSGHTQPQEPVSSSSGQTVPVTETQAPHPTPTPAAKGDGVDRDWVRPPPGDWGGVLDPQGIKEPDSSGVLFFLLLVGGLSVGVHQITRFLGTREQGERLLRPTAGVPAALVATPSPRTLAPRPASSGPSASARAEPSAETLTTTSFPAGGEAQPEDRREGLPSTSSAAPAAPAVGAAAPLQDEGPVGQPGRSGAADAAAVTGAAEEGAGERQADGAEAPVSESEVGREEAATESEEVSEEHAEAAAGVQEEQQQQQPGPSPLAQPSASGAGGEAEAEAKIAAAALQPSGPTAQQQQQREQEEEGQRQQQGPAAGPGPGSAQLQAGPGAGEPVKRGLKEGARLSGLYGVFGRGGTPDTQSRLVTPTSDGRATADRLPPQQDQAAGPGPGSLAGGRSAPAPPRPWSPFSAPSPPGFGAGTGVSTGTGGAADGVATAPFGAAAAPARISLPSVRPEPLSRAPDSSALAHLPTDGSLGSLRERAQLTLRAAASAIEASQRAAAYAAAASSAASRAAEAAERAATAATMAQAGLESAAESAIVAAEARVAQAAEAAKEAEGRAASAAAHATAYQDMAQSQADIAERASIVVKPPPPGPLSQLHQLWRSASSAFAHQVHADAADQESTPASEERGAGPLDPDQRGTSSRPSASGAADSGSAGPKSPGSGAAETISTTFKGLLSWLGQGQGDSSR